MADKATLERLKDQALEMRELILKLSNKTMVHLGGDMSMADMMTALYMYKMKKDLTQVKWSGRDRFVLSKGHGAGCLYIAMAMAGYGSIDEIFETYGQYGSRYGMHPCKNQNPGMDASSGSLGQGLSLCAGMASTPTDADNGMRLEPLADKWKAFGWNVVEIDGNCMEEIVDALDNIPEADTDVPTVIIGNTTKGYGVSFMENTANWHHGALNDEQLKQALTEIKATRLK